MNKLIKVLGVLFVFCAFTSGAFWLRGNPTASVHAQPGPAQEG